MLSRRFLGSFLRNSTASRFAMATQNKRNNSSYLLKAVDTDENERLNIQHRMCMHMLQEDILHQSIPKKLERVADIATANGTWLYDIKDAREKEPESRIVSTKYHGFDLSPELFPKPDSPRKVADIDFTAHNFYKPFPQEHIGKYDLVHARHLILAVEGEDLIPATEHITSLLKPGGYLQWEEYDFQDQLDNCHPCKMTTTWTTILNWVGERYSLRFSDKVRDQVAAAGLEIVEKKQFTTRGLPLSEDHRLTLLFAFHTGVPRVCLKAKGKSDEEIEKIYAECLEELESGVILDYYMSRVVARKPVN
ncbi:hypothetical protein ASPVEDRAFT_142718 [Aspergillus versicolor CBS 583.65]|uniref:Methyltransferase domain-containing protein n=1 Tax=Aspergillus versicolor CBS 583.65 TaxID=1036611 RepID=A0A1L9Q1F0_ASPVE|nr:uncharacterized protein ASPVEDRAFT_142718 [Aspergillus versicolor CBS 583.65]OJJ07549.1 hypothetical protein ASPVEDRAFT_142718 [Aspergillus versicolor CBS 583.65]